MKARDIATESIGCQRIEGKKKIKYIAMIQVKKNAWNL